jgi:hypothetical protein
MSNNTWQVHNSVVRSVLVVPTHGFGKGDVCPQAAAYERPATTMRKRHLDAIQATQGSALAPWSPPVT